ncbi:zinc finger CW-type PWWP domain protein 1 [Candoia aspera]|uniref:zinc finger CW-type PWWP domain protein 1 n=1 Tax=Candoia aspera TaxID=51853 RepID=UPI002FD7C4E8
MQKEALSAGFSLTLTHEGKEEAAALRVPQEPPDLYPHQWECSGEQDSSLQMRTPHLVASRGTLEAFLAAGGNDWGKKTEVMASEVARKERQFRMKKQSKSCVRKDEKKINERAEANNVGCKENRKGEPKKTVRGNAQDVTGQEEVQEEEADGGSGSSSWCTAWVQCSHPNCEKWRKLSRDVDPSALPEDWTCSQNPDLQYSSCSVPEETWSGSENEVVYAIYFPGSIVWAKQYGYAWWPGIIEADPDIEEYFLFSSQADSLPSKYHVTFFGNSVTRAWISASLLKNFGEPPKEGNALAKLRNKCEKENLKAALEMAKEAEQIGIQERIRRFGFHSRFKDKESPKDYKTLKDRNNVTSRPWAKRTQETKGGEKNAAASSKHQEKLLHEISVVKPSANIKKTLNMKGFKKSSSAPQRKTTQTRLLSSCPDNSTADLALSRYPSKKDSLHKSEGSPGAQRKWMPRRGAVGEPRETLGLGRGEEEALSSLEVAVSAEEEGCSSEDFCLTFFQD